MSDQPTTVVHGVSGSGEDHIVGIGSLRVRVHREDGCWFAQGLEIDYLALGDSLDQVQAHFEEGLLGTVDEHLKVHGHIGHLLVPAPPDVWTQAMKDAMTYTQVSLHRTPLQTSKIPFGEIAFIQSAEARASENVAARQ